MRFIWGLVVAMGLWGNEFREMPKAELHLHLGGAWPKEWLLGMATEEERGELERCLAVVAGGVDYRDVFRVFQIVAKLVNSEERVRRGVGALCESLWDDGVEYVEIRTGLKDLGKGHEEYLKAVLGGVKLVRARVLLSLQRNATGEMVRKTVDLALRYGEVVGIDISGDSTLGQVEAILPELMRAKEGGLFFVVHVGETVGERDQMVLLEALEPKRVGHGVYLSQEAREWIVKRKVPLEVCLTSSVLVKMIERVEEHPGITLYREGHPIVFCTDDPLLFSTSLSKEYGLAKECGLTVEEIGEVARKAFEY
jgi:adenosine deaminase